MACKSSEGRAKCGTMRATCVLRFPSSSWVTTHSYVCVSAYAIVYACMCIQYLYKIVCTERHIRAYIAHVCV